MNKQIVYGDCPLLIIWLLLIISSIPNWNMDKIFQTKDVMFVRFDWDTNQVYFFQRCSQCSSLSSCWIRVLSSNLESEVMSRTSVIYLNAKKHMPFWSSFLLFRIIDLLNPIAMDEYAWAVETWWTWSGGTPSVERGFESSHPYFFLNLLFNIYIQNVNSLIS